jgi:hypothetical protein
VSGEAERDRKAAALARKIWLIYAIVTIAAALVLMSTTITTSANACAASGASRAAPCWRWPFP